MKTTTQLVHEGYLLKQEIDAKTKRLREINSKISEMAEFKDGKKTGYLTAGNIAVKVVVRENTKWDQKKLLETKPHLKNFNDIFKTEFKPISAKHVEIAMADENFKKAIEWTRTINPGSPSVTYEYLEENPHA